MEQKKMPSYIKNLKDQRLKLKQAKTVLDHLNESAEWVNAHSLDEMMEMELSGMLEAVRCSKSLIQEALDFNNSLEGEIRKPPTDLVRMLKERRRPKAVEEYEEV